jgi:hypothetical protein
MVEGEAQQCGGGLGQIERPVYALSRYSFAASTLSARREVSEFAVVQYTMFAAVFREPVYNDRL